MGGEVYLAEYGRAKTIHFDLIEVDGVDLRVDAVDAGADCIVMTDEAAEGTATNDFVDEGTGYSLVLTAAEMAGARITVYVIDSATKVWLDKTIQIETFGHQSSAHPNMSPYWTNGAVNGGTPSATVFIVDGFTEATDDHLIGGDLIFTSGANLGQARKIVDYDDTTGTQTVTVAPGFLAIPADNDEFVILPKNAITTESRLAELDSGNLPTDIAAIPTTAMRGTDNAALASEVTAVRMATLTDWIDGGRLDLLLDLIKTVTDKFVFTVANVVDANALRIDGDDDAAKQLRDNLDTTQRFIVHNAFTPTTTQCQPDAVFFGDTAGTLEATDDHYKGRIMLFLTGVLQGQATDITAYDGTNKRFTYTALTEAPGNDDQFVVI